MDEWAHLRPRFDWRPSQRHLLDLARHVGDRRWHLSAPPGSGKTLIGLELARWVARPTIVLAPTTAIRDQWREATAMFDADPLTFTSRDPDVPAPLLAVTYQLLGNPGEASAQLRGAARRLWLKEVAAEFGPEEAEGRVAAVEAGEPDRAGREIRRHARVLRRTLSTGADVGVPREALLGERAAGLVEHLARVGIGCVVLDECHHLLDWWALVVAALVERLASDGEVAVIGLTATLPEPDSSREAENYLGLLGDVDAEMQLAAMVAEGAVAPWGTASD